MSMKQTALDFVNACDGGDGWDVCKKYCHDGATFSCQADALADISTLEAYTEWAKGLLTPLPDANFEIKAFAVDEERGKAIVAAVFRATHTVDAGSPPTGKSVATDYTYVMEFDGDRIRRMTKIWNDGHALRQIGWA